MLAETDQLDAHGFKKGRSRSTAYRPVLGVQIEATYDNPANHAAELRARLSTLHVGQRFFRGLDGTVRSESVAMPKLPFGPFADEEITLGGKKQSLFTHRLQATFDRIRSSALYQPSPSWNTPPSLLPSGPTPTPAPRGALFWEILACHRLKQPNVWRFRDR